jgi:hypothetical protein
MAPRWVVPTVLVVSASALAYYVYKRQQDAVIETTTDEEEMPSLVDVAEEPTVAPSPTPSSPPVSSPSPAPRLPPELESLIQSQLVSVQMPEEYMPRVFSAIAGMLVGAPGDVADPDALRVLQPRAVLSADGTSATLAEAVREDADLPDMIRTLWEEGKETGVWQEHAAEWCRKAGPVAGEEDGALALALSGPLWALMWVFSVSAGGQILHVGYIPDDRLTRLHVVDPEHSGTYSTAPIVVPLAEGQLASMSVMWRQPGEPPATGSAATLHVSRRTPQSTPHPLLDKEAPTLPTLHERALYLPWFSFSRGVAQLCLESYIDGFDQVCAKLHGSEATTTEADGDDDGTLRSPIRLYTDVDLVISGLQKSTSFVLVPSVEEADAVFSMTDLHGPSRVLDTSGVRRINQFTNELPRLTSKGGLCRTLLDHFGGTASQEIAPLTFDLNTHLAPALGWLADRWEAQEEGREESDPTAAALLVKPSNQGRGLGIVPVRNGHHLVALASLGHRVAQRVLHPPLTFKGRKFDLRLIILVRRARPLRLARFHMYWTRASNVPYTNDIDDRRAHITVHNYNDSEELEEISMAQMDQELGAETMRSALASCDAVSRSVMEAAVCEKCCVDDNPVARFGTSEDGPTECAMYGLDMMLVRNARGDVEARCLEVNFSPDTVRASYYDTDFWPVSCAYMFQAEDEWEQVVRDKIVEL